MLMNLDLAKRSGMSDEAAIDYAVDQVERTQGGYGSENQQRIMNHPYWRVPTQFMKYPMMYATLYYDAVSRIVKPGDRGLAAKELLNMSILGMIMSGTTGLAFWEVGHAMAIAAAMVMGGSDDTWDDFDNWQQQALQDILGMRWGEALARGLPRLFNVDVSDRMAQDTMVLSGDPLSYQLDDLYKYFGKMALGAAGGVVTDGYMKKINEAETWGDYANIFLLPKVFSDIKKAVERTNDVTRNQYGTITGDKYKPYEAVLQGLGFNPASRAHEYEPGGPGYERIEEQKLRHERTKLMGEYYAAPQSEKGAIWRKIRDFSRGKPKDLRVSFDDLHKSKRKRQQDERKDVQRRRNMEASR
jgi:hypothetical protein